MINRCLLFILVLTVHGFSSVFPTLTGQSLGTPSVSIPHPRGNQWLLLGFDRASSDAMADWVRALSLQELDANWLQVAVIGGVPPFIDGFIKNGIKSTVPFDIHHRFFPYFGNQRAAIVSAITSDGLLADAVTPVLVCLDPEGKVLFSLQDTPTTASITVVMDALSTCFNSSDLP